MAYFLKVLSRPLICSTMLFHTFVHIGSLKLCSLLWCNIPLFESWMFMTSKKESPIYTCGNKLCCFIDWCLVSLNVLQLSFDKIPTVYWQRNRQLKSICIWLAFKEVLFLHYGSFKKKSNPVSFHWFSVFEGQALVLHKTSIWKYKEMKSMSKTSHVSSTYKISTTKEC